MKKSNSLLIGTTLVGQQQVYHVEEVLGHGGYGITYKVWAVIKNGQIPVKVPFAIKEHFVNGRCHRASDGITVEYPSEAAEEVEESLRDFIKEGHLLRKISQTEDEANKNIVPVNEVIEANNTAYYVMQYLEGGSLRDMVLANHGGLTEAKALTLIKPIAKAVEYIHQHKILHMDIKPSNIVMHKDLIKQKDEPVLIDFGVSLHFNKKGGLTSKHSSIGRTEGFSPIEQYTEIEKFLPQVDVYALGATLCYLLTGKVPPSAFHLTPSEIDLILPNNISGRTRKAIKHAMQKEYHNRTASASTFLWELENDDLITEDTNITVKKRNEHGTSTVTIKKKVNKGSGIPLTTIKTISKAKEWIRQNGKIGATVLAVLLLGYGTYKLFTSTGYSNKESEPATAMSDSENANNATDSWYSEVEAPQTDNEYPEDALEDTFVEDVNTNNTPVPAHSQNQPSQNKPSNDGSKKDETHPTKHDEQKNNNVQDTSPSPPLKKLNDDELFAKALADNDWKTIEALGNKGYKMAYYELARHYWKTGDAVSGKKWAEKAIAAGIQTDKARTLLKEFE